MDSDATYRRVEGVMARPLDEGGVLYWSDRERLFVLNETGYLIWRLCDGGHSIAEITDAVTAEFSVDLATARRDVEAYLTKLVEIELLEPASVSPGRPRA